MIIEDKPYDDINLYTGKKWKYRNKTKPKDYIKKKKAIRRISNKSRRNNHNK